MPTPVGALAVVEHPFEVGGIMPPTSTTARIEFSIVLEGEIGFRSEDKEIVLGPGRIHREAARRGPCDVERWARRRRMIENHRHCRIRRTLPDGRQGID